VPEVVASLVQHALDLVFSRRSWLVGGIALHEDPV
jgi:hypothetical protein